MPVVPEGPLLSLLKFLVIQSWLHSPSFRLVLHIGPLPREVDIRKQTSGLKVAGTGLLVATLLSQQ